MSSTTACPLEGSLRHAVGATRAYFTPALVLIGCLGNAATLAIFILEARLTRWNRFGVYCSALAVSDACVLIFSGLLDDFLGRGLMHAVGRKVVKLDAASSGSCKSLEFLQNYFLWLSAHLLIAFTLDRLLGVWRPMRFAARRCVRVTLGVIVGVAVAGLALTAPVAAVYDVTETAAGNDGNGSATARLSRSCHVAVSCNSTGRSRLATFVVYYKGFGVFVVPFLLQAALSAALLCRLLRIRRRRRELLSPAASGNEQRMELSRYYANLALSLASCLLACPLCVAIVMRAGCGLCAPRNDCRCRYLEQLTKVLDSIQDVSFGVGFWVYLACVRSFRQRVAFACAVICVRGGLGGLCPGGWAPLRRAEELVARDDRRRRPESYANSQLRQHQSGGHGSCVGGVGSGSSSVCPGDADAEMLPLASPKTQERVTNGIPE